MAVGWPRALITHFVLCEEVARYYGLNLHGKVCIVKLSESGKIISTAEEGLEES